MMIDVDRTGRFSLAPDFMATYAKAPVQWRFGALSWFTYQRTYSRRMDNGAQEQWHQTCQRVIEGMFTLLRWRCKSMHLPWSDEKAQGMAQDAYARMFDFKWLPPGRGLWMMGTEFVYQEGGASLNNCGMASTADMSADPARPFCWAFHMLMLGVGIGFDTEGARAQLRLPDPSTATEVFVIPDDRQGWIEALRLYMMWRFMGDHPRPIFDYSQIRPAGTPIRRFGGTASGPGPLIEMFQLMDVAFARAYKRPRIVDSTLITDLMNIVGRCVVSGNVRRSAQIALGRPDDNAFRELKAPGVIGDWRMSLQEQLDAGQRPWAFASNNSLIVRDEDDPDYSVIARSIAENGEPGLIWLDHSRNYGRMVDGFNPGADPRVVGVNPCAEQSLESYELCCLVETFPAHHATTEDYLRTLSLAYLYAKVVTCLPTHDVDTNSVMRSNARIGLSMSGVVQSIEQLGLKAYTQLCDRAYRYIRDRDEVYSRWMAAPRSIKMTSIKPSGTVSLVAGASPGCHDDHAPFTIRRVRVGDDHPLVEQARRAGYHVEPDVVTPRTMVVSFPTHTPGLKRAKQDVSMWEQFSRAAMIQRWWADNAVSVTVTFAEHEKRDIEHALRYFAPQLKGLSMLPLDVSSYAQLPYEAIDEATYREMMAKVNPDLIMVEAIEHDQTDRFCDGDACAIK